MFRYEDIQVVHLEPSTRCQAACPMCARNMRGGRVRGNIPLVSISFEQFRAWMPRAFLAGLKRLYACGNFGDPIVAPDLLEILGYVRAQNAAAALNVHTNGGARPAAFWRRLAELDVSVNFGIDGAQAASHLRYRRHTDFDMILRNAGAFIEAGGKATWTMLLFEHNDAELEAAEAMARRLGFTTFVGKSTGRFSGPAFEVHDAGGAVVDTLRPSMRHPFAKGDAKPSADVLAACDIACKALEEKAIYLAADGFVVPCCWLGLLVNERPGAPDGQFEAPGRGEDLRRFFDVVDGVGAGAFSLKHRSLESIVDGAFGAIERAWGPGVERLGTCARVCGAHGAQRFQPQFFYRADLTN